MDLFGPFEHRRPDIRERILTREHTESLLSRPDSGHLRTYSDRIVASGKSPLFYPVKIFVNNGRRLVGVDIQDIAYCKANKDFTNIVTVNNMSLLSARGIGILEKNLDPRCFLRIHRSYIINLKHAKLLSTEFSRYFFNINDVDIPVSRQYLPFIKQLIF